MALDFSGGTRILSLEDPEDNGPTPDPDGTGREVVRGISPVARERTGAAGVCFSTGATVTLVDGEGAGLKLAARAGHGWGSSGGGSSPSVVGPSCHATTCCFTGNSVLTKAFRPNGCWLSSSTLGTLDLAPQPLQMTRQLVALLLILKSPRCPFGQTMNFPHGSSNLNLTYVWCWPAVEITGM